MTKRVYFVEVRDRNSEDIEESFEFPVKRKPETAKNQALKKAKSLSKVYDEDYCSLVCGVYVEYTEKDKDLFYLDRHGNEDTKYIDWLF